MIILGIDPGLANTGCGVIRAEKGRVRILSCGVITTKPGTPLSKRLMMIFRDIRDLCREYNPDVAAVESIFFAANVKTAVAVAQARGVAILATEERGLELEEYSPLQIKQAIVGYGRATKKQVQEMVKVLLKLKEIPKPDHAADALAVALTYAFRTRL
jgi:crossover junction endodeoxyribonuclease RuvC